VIVPTQFLECYSCEEMCLILTNEWMQRALYTCIHRDLQSMCMLHEFGMHCIRSKNITRKACLIWPLLKFPTCCKVLVLRSLVLYRWFFVILFYEYLQQFFHSFGEKEINFYHSQVAASCCFAASSLILCSAGLTLLWASAAQALICSVP
jgi:hypothetical protein